MKAVLFDMDGVLVNSEWLNEKAGMLSLAEQGVKLTGQDRKVITGRNPADFMPILRKKYVFDVKKAIARHQFHYRRMYTKVKQYPGAKQLLNYVRSKGCKIALVTGTPRAVVKRALKKFGFGKFDAIVPFEDCKKRKPAPDVYLLAAKRLGVKPSDCVVVEDSIPGVEAARRAGMKCVAVTTNVPAVKLKKATIRVRSITSKRLREFLC